LKARRVISLLLTLAFLALAVRFSITFPWKAMLAALAAAQLGWILFAAVVHTLSVSAKAQGWALLMAEPARPHRRLAHAATFVGAAAGAVTISIGGEAARIRWLMTHSSIAMNAAVRAVVASRVTEAISLAIIIIAGARLLPNTPWVTLTLTAAFAVVVLAAGLWLTGNAPDAREHATGKFARLVLDARSALRNPGVAGALWYGSLNWAAQWIAFYASVVAVRGHCPIAYPLAALVFANVAGALKLTPANVGIVTASFVVAAPLFGVRADTAVAASIVVQAIEVLPVVLVGGLIMARETWKRRRLGA
jgi:uncharacterized membrane protein YbhN (UPF0104 family)